MMTLWRYWVCTLVQKCQQGSYLNWEAKIQRVIIKQENKRNLTIMGKVLIVKIFLLSNFVYLMQGLILPTYVLKKMDQIVYKFLWKRDYSENKAFKKATRSVINAEYERGGLNMMSACDIQAAFKAIIWTNMLEYCKLDPWGKFGEMLIEINIFSFRKMHVKMSSGKLRPFCLGLSVLI